MDWAGRANVKSEDQELWLKSDQLWEHGHKPEQVVCKEFSGRTMKRVMKTKAEHRTDISPERWNKYEYSKTWSSMRETLIENCKKHKPCVGVHGSSVTLETFQSRFEKSCTPCMIHGLADEWNARTAWNLRDLREKYGERPFKCGEDDDGYPLKLKLKHFFRYQASANVNGARDDDSPLYVFDSAFEDDKVSKELLNDYKPPDIFSEDLFHLVGEARRPPYRWVLFGPERSGSNVHQDPLGTSAWNTLLKGRKLWFLMPPRVPRRLVKAKHLMKKGEDDEPLDWFFNLLPRMLEEAGPDLASQAISFIQYPGETVYVPSNWWHAVLNLDDTMAVTQNYVSSGNFDTVWCATRVGRKRMAFKWRNQLKIHYPQLHRRSTILDDMDKYDLDGEIAEADERKKRKRKKEEKRKKKQVKAENSSSGEDAKSE